jgi:Capsule assembly protein Wzi
MRCPKTIMCMAIIVSPVALLNLCAQVGASASTGQKTTADAQQSNPANMASTYVPLDSWVYPAIERLAALGYVQTDFAGQRPWTRMECARLVIEAGERAADNSETEAGALYRSLSFEFALELRRGDGAPNTGFQVESIYSQVVGISGQPVVDGYHFAQTLANDFGRPYGEGTNSYTGAALRAVAGPIAFYVRGEYQKSGTVIQPSQAAQAAIAAADFTPAASAGPPSNVSGFRLIDAYVALAFKNNQLSFGQQSLWWGPDSDSAMIFSDNAQSIPMLRYDRVSPFKLPGFLGVLGPMRVQFFIGRLSGQQFAQLPNGNIAGHAGVSLGDQPFIHGMKWTLKPTPNLELGFSRTVIFGGPGFPVTFNSFSRSVFSTQSGNFTGNDPGDRRAGFDFSYRIPGLRDWLTLYGDSFADDEPFPPAYPTHSAWSPGLYLSKLPYLHKVDLRAEGAFTPDRLFPGFFYFNVHYLDGYTNARQIMGSWVGRQGSAWQLSSTYWFSGRNTLQFGYRSMWVDHSFLQGGWVRDISANTNLALGANFALQAGIQYERWQFPLLSPGPVSNVTTSVQISYTPRWSVR